MQNEVRQQSQAKKDNPRRRNSKEMAPTYGKKIRVLVILDESRSKKICGGIQEISKSECHD